MEKLIGVQEAARLTGYHPNRIRLYAQKGFLKFYRITPKSNIKFTKKDLAEFMNHQILSKT